MKTEEILNIINAHKEGKTIEYRFKVDLDKPSNRSNEWAYEVPSNEDYNWNFAMYDYRIKEEPKTRPYGDEYEFFKAMKEHGPSIDNRFIPIRADEIGIYFYSSGISDDIDLLKYSDLVCFKWQDGTPCSIQL